jgi:predicted secreted hydrolase
MAAGGNLVMLRQLWLLVSLLLYISQLAIASPNPTTTFPIQPHDNVNVEWWYVNAHVTTERGRHLAVVGSFFRFGKGVSPFDGVTPMPRAHYLLFAVTDLDRKVQRSYSMGDTNMVQQLKVLTMLQPAENPNAPAVKALTQALNSNKLPAPHEVISGQVQVTSKPFSLDYGSGDRLTATGAQNLWYTISLNDGKDKIQLTLSSQKAPMAVGGKGETGLVKPSDMHYFSLTRCQVGGTIDTGDGPERVSNGEGWIDHQWGDSWVAQNDGWDWWGVQMDNGTDILFFRQRDLATGRIFYPLATFMDKDGHLTVTKKIVFRADPKSLWRSSRSGVRYPLGWTVTFPEKNLKLHIGTTVKDQEIPTLGAGGAIWEGSCSVSATPITASDYSIPGVAYMELVGYNSPAVKAQLTKH